MRSKKTSVAIEQDCQAFGELVAEHISLATALSHPLTKYPLIIADTEGNLRTGSKSTLRKLLVSSLRSNALSLEIDTRTSGHRVLYDGFAPWRRFFNEIVPWLTFLSQEKSIPFQSG